VQELIVANTKIAELNNVVASLKEEILGLSVRLETSDNEVNRLKIELHKTNQNAKKKTCTETDKLRKDLKVLQDENGKPKKEIDNVNKTTARREHPQPKMAKLKNQATNTMQADPEEGVVYFRGWWNPLSAFHKSGLQFKGKSFPTVEHCYQYQKAVFHNNHRAAWDI